jgi:hypothetical protein
LVDTFWLGGLRLYGVGTWLYWCWLGRDNHPTTQTTNQLTNQPTDRPTHPPGNILVRQGGAIALLDYGQSKQLPAKERDALAHLILALHK